MHTTADQSVIQKFKKPARARERDEKTGDVCGGDGAFTFIIIVFVRIAVYYNFLNDERARRKSDSQCERERGR